MIGLKGEIQNHDLTGGRFDGRKFIMTVVNYGLFREYIKIDMYDVFTGIGYQRATNSRHVNKLCEAFTSGQYTPDVFHVSVSNQDSVLVEDGNATITLSDESSLNLLNGGHRYCALEKIRANGGTNTRLVDNLPIPLVILLDKDMDKKDFTNLNCNLSVNRSHILNMQIDDKMMGTNQENTDRARELTKLLHINNNSPIHNLVSFGADGNGVLASRVLCSSRKGELPSNLFGTAKVLERIGQANDWWFTVLCDVHNFVRKNSLAYQQGKLLCLPPDGPKGAVYNLFGVVNCWMYYLYLEDRFVPEPSDWNILKKSIDLYDEPVNGDLNRHKRANLLGAFSQNLFSSMANNPDHPAGFHFGHPIALVHLLGHSGFATEKPPVPIGEKKKKGRSKSNPVITHVDSTVQPSDTTEDFFEENV